MKGRALTGILIVLGFSLGMMLFASDRSITRLMETCGEFISNALGL